jgi:hypothetical protein
VIDSRRLLIALSLCLLAPATLAAQENSGEPPEEEPAAVEDEAVAPPTPRFRLRAEAKLHYRDTEALEFRDPFPFPPPFLPPGQDAVFLRPPEAGRSFEVSTVNLIGEANLSPNVAGKIEIHFIDLYNRNPTSSDNDVQLREAWLRFGQRFDGPTTLAPGTSFYLLAGKAPRFSRQRVRRLETYGLWSTAVGRFEELQVEVGGTVGPHLYWRAQVGNGNPLFMRDPNALAGDNGTPQHVPGSVDPIYESGFPILYDTKATDIDVDGQLQTGAGLGFKLASDENHGLDLLGWYFQRDLAPEVDLPGTFYSGDIKLLQGPFLLFPLPFSGDRKREWGVNAELEWGGLALFAQYVDQEIANLPRSGGELEVAYRFELPGILISDTPVFRWLQPVGRWSRIENDFTAPALYPNPAVDWDWMKIDLGVRLGIVPGIDLTAEYALNEVDTDEGKIRPDELLVTLRASY